MEHLQAALLIFREIGDKASEALCLHSIGSLQPILAIKAAASSDVTEHQTAALAIHREVGDRRGEAGTLRSLGTTYAALAQFDKAIEHLSAAVVATLATALAEMVTW